MRNLLAANFLRLKKSVLFWGTLAFMAGYALWRMRFWIVFNEVTIDPMIFDYAGAVGVVAAVWSSLFLGTDYSDGTLRNKLTAGHSRNAVYLAGLITNTSAALLQCAAYLAVALGSGSFLIGPPRMEAGRLLLLLAGTLVTVIAFCAIFTAVGMLCARKTVTAVVCIAGSFALLGYLSSVDSYLNIPQYSAYIDVPENGAVSVTYELNSGYVSGTRRAVFVFLDDATPFSQAVQYMRSRQRDEISLPEDGFSEAQIEEYRQHMRPPVAPLPLMAYSLAVIALSTGAGVALFRRKDLK